MKLVRAGRIVFFADRYAVAADGKNMNQQELLLLKCLMGWVSLCLEIHQQIINLRLTQDADEPGRHRGDLREKGFVDIVSRYNHSLLGDRITSCLDMISFDMHRLPNNHFSIREHVSRVAILGAMIFEGIRIDSPIVRLSDLRPARVRSGPTAVPSSPIR